MDKEQMKKYAIYGGVGLAVLLVILAMTRKSAPASFSAGPSAQEAAPVVYAGEAGGINSATYDAIGQGLETIAANQYELAEAIATSQNSAADQVASALQEMRNFQQQQAANQTGTQTVTTTNTQAAPQNKIMVVGSSTDLSLIKNYLEAEGKLASFHFVDSSSMSDAETRSFLLSHPNAYVLGGPQASGGVSDAEIQGTGLTRIWGSDRFETLNAFKRSFSF